MRNLDWLFVVLILAQASSIPKNENTDFDDQHFEDGYHNLIEEDNNDQDALENPEQDKMEGEEEKEEEEREAKQLQFSRLMERCVCFFLLIVRFFKL